jgi:multiple sugar transport system permease protein
MAAITATAGKSLAQRKREEALTGYAFLAPALLIFLVFLFLPIFFAIYISFTDWNGITPLNQPNAYNFIGLENYNKLLFQQGISQRDFYTALKNTVYFVLGVVPTQTILALLLAVVVNQKWLRAKGAFRTAFYFPSITSSVVISLIFMWMFTRGGIVNDSNGLIHNFLGLFGITRNTVGDWASTRVASLTLWDWISGPSVTMFTIMVLNTWTTIGTMMVIFLAALQNIPAHVYEAASVDGATGFQALRRITIPLLRPTTFFVVTLGQNDPDDCLHRLRQRVQEFGDGAGGGDGDCVVRHHLRVLAHPAPHHQRTGRYLGRSL